MSYGPPDYEIALRDPEPVLQGRLGENVRLLGFESEPLGKTGDNYGSTIMKVCAKIRRGSDNEEETLHLVAKMLPPTNIQRTIFDSEFTFKKEIFIYEQLIPLYEQLMPAGEFDVVPKFYGSRLSCVPGAEEADEDAVVFMENLKAKGYYMADRHRGLDAAHLKLAISTLAKFHAVGLSVKIKKPSYLSLLKKYGKPMKSNNDLMEQFQKATFDNLRQDPRISIYIDRIISIKSDSCPGQCYYSPLEPEHEWACIVHGDCWTNNVLFHKDEAGNVDDVKIVDFQTYYVASPLTDLLFLLCTSAESSLSGFDEALELYRLTVVGVLGQLGCDAGFFEKDQFERRLRIDAPNELVHAVMMTKVVELRHGESLIDDPMNEACLSRIRRILEVYAEKKWI